LPEKSITISVVIPAYNAAAHLERTIKSVLAQTHPADEIIVVDDGSSDDTAGVVGFFGDKVILLCQENAGASVARNTGIKTAKGDWIAFLDADDEWLPEKLQLQVEHLQRNPDLVWTMGNYICCCCEEDHRQWVYDQQRSAALLAGRQYYEDYFDSYKNGTCGCTGTMVIKKSVLFDAGLFRPGQPRMNDEDMWFRIAYRNPKIGYLTQPLTVYHQGTPGSIVKKHNQPEIVIELINRHLELAEQQGRLDAFRSVARSIAKMWIHWSWQDERIFRIRFLLKKLGFLLPRGYKTMVYLLTMWPRCTLACMPLLRKLNKILKLSI
jgi:glycosyltransferase involved in cell wall biosynthesis